MVTWRLPSSRLTVPTLDFGTPAKKILPPGATVNGGQVFAQSPLQFDTEGLAVSLSNRYNVSPAPLTTTGSRAPAWEAFNCTHFRATFWSAVLAVPSDPVAQSPVFAVALCALAVPASKDRPALPVSGTCALGAAGAGPAAKVGNPHALNDTAPATTRTATYLARFDSMSSPLKSRAPANLQPRTAETRAPIRTGSRDR